MLNKTNKPTRPRRPTVVKELSPIFSPKLQVLNIAQQIANSEQGLHKSWLWNRALNYKEKEKRGGRGEGISLLIMHKYVHKFKRYLCKLKTFKIVRKKRKKLQCLWWHNPEKIWFCAPREEKEKKVNLWDISSQAFALV